MTESDIITEILEREGGWRDAVKRPDGTIDPATNHGITLPTLQAWADRHRVDASTVVMTEGSLRTLSPEAARGIYSALYITEPGFTPANIPFEPLRVQLIDYGVNSGPERAVRWLQRTLHSTAPEITGRLDAATLKMIDYWQGVGGDTALAIVNDALVAARCEMIREAIAAGHIAKSDERGLLRRAISFTLTKS